MNEFVVPKGNLLKKSDDDKQNDDRWSSLLDHSVHFAIKLLSHLFFTDLGEGEKHVLTFKNSYLDHSVVLAIKLTKREIA